MFTVRSLSVWTVTEFSWIHHGSETNHQAVTEVSTFSFSLTGLTKIPRAVLCLTRPPAGCWSERTEVHKAASLGQASELQQLIRSGASVNVVAVDSITPLHEACLRGQAQCARLLLDAGAQVE